MTLAAAAAGLSRRPPVFICTKASWSGKGPRVGAAQLHLHVGVDDAGRERDDLGAVVQQRFFERLRARQVIERRLDRAVRALRGHRAAAEARRNVQHALVGRPVARGTQEGRGQQQRRLEADAHRCRQRRRIRVAQRPGFGQQGRVVDQCGAGEVARRRALRARPAAARPPAADRRGRMAIVRGRAGRRAPGAKCRARHGPVAAVARRWPGPGRAMRR